MRIAAFCCASQYQNWIPEVLYYQKLVSHSQIGPESPKLETRVLKRVLVRNAAFHCVSRYQNWIPEILYMQKMYSHVQIRPRRPEIAGIILYYFMCRGCVIFSQCHLWEGKKITPNFLKIGIWAPRIILRHFYSWYFFDLRPFKPGYPGHPTGLS